MPGLQPLRTGSTTPGAKNDIEYYVEYGENAEGARYAYNQSVQTLTVSLPYADTYETLFIQDMLGFAEPAADGRLVRVLPERCPYNSKLYCTDISLKKSLVILVDGDLVESNIQGLPRYGQRFYTVTYTRPKYDLLEDEDTTVESERFCVYNGTSETENQQIPGGSYQVDGIPLAEVGVKTGAVMTLNVTWIGVPRYDLSRLDEYANTVNDRSIVLNGTIYAAEKVLFETYSFENTHDVFGDPTLNLTLRFGIRLDDRTWNQLWQGYDNKVTPTDADGNKIYREKNHDEIWKVS